jgi:hypothetical protein
MPADSLIIAERVIGVRWGVMYGFSWREKTTLKPDPSETDSKLTGWGIVYPILMPYDTTLGFSLRGEDGAYIGHGPYGEGQWSFPIWPLALACLIPEMRLRWKRRRARRADRTRTCRACGYDLRATPSRCPECGVIPVAVGDGVRIPKGET